MKNLFNWIFGNKKYLINYEIHNYVSKFYVKNEIVWAKSNEEIIQFVLFTNKIHKRQLLNISKVNIPNFSKAKKHTHKEKEYLILN